MEESKRLGMVNIQSPTPALPHSYGGGGQPQVGSPKGGRGILCEFVLICPLAAWNWAALNGASPAGVRTTCHAGMKTGPKRPPTPALCATPPPLGGLAAGREGYSALPPARAKRGVGGKAHHRCGRTCGAASNRATEGRRLLGWGGKNA